MALIAKLLGQIAIGVSILLIWHLLWHYVRSPLKNIPGPFLAKFTNLWRLFHVLTGHAQRTQKQLHDRYGSAVRLGPNLVTLSDPRLVKVVYDARGKFLKSDFYASNDLYTDGKRLSNLFNTRSNELHSKMLKPIQKYFAMSNILLYEPLADQTIMTLMQKLDQSFAATGDACHFDDWLLYCTWDMMSFMTFSAPMGFMNAGGDVQGIIKSLEWDTKYFALVGQIPFLDVFLDKNPVIRMGFNAERPGVKISFDRIMARVAKTDGHSIMKQPDFLDHYLQEKEKNEHVDLSQVLGWLILNMFAGSDTTGITLCAILYHVLKDSKIHRKLRAALKEASLVYPVSYNDAKEISYLSVIISEATRVHPVIGLPLERVVPQEGLRLPDGRFLPAGTIVGMNPWVVNRDEGVYGADADHFVPERWLQQEDETGAEWKERSRKMRESDLTFGGENRVCLGKNAGLVEIYKLTATLFSVYKVCLFNIVTDPSHFFISASDSRYGEVKQLTEWGRGVSDGIRGPHQRMGGYQYMVHVSNRAKDPL